MRIEIYNECHWTAICCIYNAARMLELQQVRNTGAFVPIEQDKQLNLLKNSEKLVAIVGGVSVGFIAYSSSFISFLYVLPQFHRQGIGTELLRSALRLTERPVSVQIFSDNAIAANIYLRSGFKQTTSFTVTLNNIPCDCNQLTLFN